MRTHARLLFVVAVYVALLSVVQPSLFLHIHMRTDMCVDMCIDMCADMCVDMGIGMCIDVRTDILYGSVYRHACRYVCGHVYGHAYRNVHRHVHGACNEHAHAPHLFGILVVELLYAHYCPIGLYAYFE